MDEIEFDTVFVAATERDGACDNPVVFMIKPSEELVTLTFPNWLDDALDVAVTRTWLLLEAPTCALNEVTFD